MHNSTPGVNVPHKVTVDKSSTLPTSAPVEQLGKKGRIVMHLLMHLGINLTAEQTDSTTEIGAHLGTHLTSHHGSMCDGHSS